MTIKENGHDSIKIKFISNCKKDFLIYKYDLSEKNDINKAYNFEDITLLVKRKYKIKNIVYGNSDGYVYDFNKISDNFFIIKPNEMHEISIPLMVFLEKYEPKHKNLKNYYLINNAFYNRYVNFRLTYNFRIIKDNILNPNNFNIYDESITSNYIKLILK